MSLSALPTEVDDIIIEFLGASDDREALSSLSYVSKYYRGPVEPVLYRNLKFQADEEVPIKQLFLTLLSRMDLAKHIESFTLSETPRTVNIGERWIHGRTKLAKDLWRQVRSIETAVKKVPRLGVETRLELFGGILFSHSGSYVSPQPSVNATIALILSWAINIKAMDLFLPAPYYLNITCEILASPLAKASPTALRKLELPAHMPVPFGRLKRVQFYCRGPQHRPGLFLSVQILAQELCIRNLHVQGCFMASNFHISDTLRVLKLRNVKIDPIAIESLISGMKNSKLAVLSLDNLQGISNNWRHWLYSRLSIFLEFNLPNLEIFECINMGGKPGMSLRPLGSLKALSELRKIRVDAEVLYDVSLALPDFDERLMLPLNLKHLEILVRSPQVLVPKRLVSDDGDDEAEIWQQYLRDPAPSIALDSVTLEINMLQYHTANWRIELMTMGPAILDKLKSCIQKHADRGVSFRIYGRTSSGDEMPMEYLMGVGFELP